ncbi:hypothetical protein PVAND_008872 [Polypedilum vanderplanki]|uniref:Zinc finger protein n=1 Tax=Polypedilum vanderplanki TaxID=319348 RepID=A0A9J6CCE5_POLVA|nr:hypothetical protein PVAND_008872 [Polypedilum vanderplanki]
MEITRKRCRSNENTIRQQKFLISDRIMEKNDAKLMEEIYKKTLNMMFAGAKRKQIKTDEAHSLEKSLQWKDDEKITDIVEDKLPENLINCNFCLNSSSSAHKSCSNCNLKVCLERCGALENCVYCGHALCENCINIFGCSIESDGIVTAICEDCKNLI